MVMAAVALLSILVGMGWLLFHLGRWPERKRQKKLRQRGFS